MPLCSPLSLTRLHHCSLTFLLLFNWYDETKKGKRRSETWRNAATAPSHDFKSDPLPPGLKQKSP